MYLFVSIWHIIWFQCFSGFFVFFIFVTAIVSAAAMPVDNTDYTTVVVDSPVADNHVTVYILNGTCVLMLSLVFRLFCKFFAFILVFGIVNILSAFLYFVSSLQNKFQIHIISNLYNVCTSERIVLFSLRSCCQHIVCILVYAMVGFTFVFAAPFLKLFSKKYLEHTSRRSYVFRRQVAVG